MENSQSVQHELTQVRGLTPKWTNSKSELTGSSNILIYLVTHHPGLLLTGLLTMFLGSAALALYSLGHVGGAEQVEPEEIPAVVERPIKTPSETSNPTPLWMVVAIALSCGSGCFILLRLLNRPIQPRQNSRKRINHYPTPLTPRPHRNWEPKTLSTPPVFVPMQPLKPIVSMPAKTKPLVTVLPAEHKHPLDKKSKESLADLMDIRKQNSLSTILRSS